MLDTAPAYGCSEKIIGEYISETGHNFRICTKLGNISTTKHLYDLVNKQISESIEQLKISYIDYYYIHNFQLVQKLPGVIDILNFHKEEGYLRNIGISIYEPWELEWILDNIAEKISIVQIPFNIFDHRWRKNGLIERTKAANISIFVRSVLLQGLLMLKNQENPIYRKAHRHLKALHSFCKQNNTTCEELAFKYVKSFDSIDYILIGCETVNQLSRNIDIFSKAEKLTDQERDFIDKNFYNVEEHIIDPRKWNG